MKVNKFIWIIPSVIVLLIIGFFALQKYTEPICGDGICKQSELSSCNIDCKIECATGAIEGNIEQTCSLGWQSTYSQGLKDGFIKAEWLTANNIYDYSDSKINELANKLKRTTPKETAKAIADWTYKNIVYDYKDIYSDCKSFSASDIYTRGSGVCSTMSKLNIALLRANGIPAYSNTGCFKYNTACQLQQSFLGRVLPKFVNITIDPTGYAPTMGYLHNWVIVPIYQNGKWEDLILESTTGLLYDDTCINYRVYYSNPTDSLACGLNSLDSNLYDCKDW